MPTAPYYDLYLCSRCYGGMTSVDDNPDLSQPPPSPVPSVDQTSNGRLVTYHSPTRFGWQKRDSGWVCPDCIAKEKS